MALPSGSPTVRGEPTGTRGKAGRRCAASRARRSSSHSYNEAIATQGGDAAGQAAVGVAELSGQRGIPRARRPHAARLRRARSRRIEAEFGDFPLSALTDRRTRGIFLAWRDKLAAKSRRQADYAWSACSRACCRGVSIAGWCWQIRARAAGGSIAARGVDKIWTADDEAAFLKSAPAHLHLPLLLALWTGQRQGDLLRLPWSAYDGTHIRLRQGKTGARVVIPVGAPLKAALDAASKRGPIILTNSCGGRGHRTASGRRGASPCKKAGIVGVTFHDLRGTAVTRLAIVGCTEAEIATITGHSLRDVRSILDAHYLHRDPALGESAIRKLERGQDYFQAE